MNILDSAASPAAPAEEKISALLPSGGLIELGRARLAVMPLETADRFGSRAPTELAVPSGTPRMPDFDVSSRMRELARGNSKRKQVALTFDDGPHPEYTCQLLAVLEHYDVKATFFFVGVQSKRHPEWVKMSHQAGHEIASQTYDHFRLPKLPYNEKVHQIDAYQQVIEELTGTTPRFLRPPGGQVDNETATIARDRNMVIGLWDVALNDTQEDRSADEMLKLALREVRPGSVVLAHDGIQATIDMLPALIEALQKKGYEFVTMSELAARK
jgi:peptidoglycan/xylan/chitin deacetylase (PgdA/CDA1 family)